MKLSTQAGIAAFAAALLASPAVFGQAKEGPPPPTGSSSEYRAAPAGPPAGAAPSMTGQTSKPAAKRGASRAAAKATSRQDYLDQSAKRFDAMDTNRDGMLTSAERRAYDQKTRASRASTAPAATAPAATSSGSRALAPGAPRSGAPADRPQPEGNRSGATPKPADAPSRM